MNPRSVPRRAERPLRSAVLWSTLTACTALACHRPRHATPFQVVPRYWLRAEPAESALASAAQRLRESVASTLREGVLEEGFPRECTVIEPEIRTAPFVPECVEGGATPDGLVLDHSGHFVQFVPIDFLSARPFLFEVYLIPDSATPASLTREALLEYPHVAITHVVLTESTYRRWLSAIMRGIRAAGAVPFGNGSPASSPQGRTPEQGVQRPPTYFQEYGSPGEPLDYIRLGASRPSSSKVRLRTRTQYSDSASHDACCSRSVSVRM